VQQEVVAVPPVQQEKLEALGHQVLLVLQETQQMLLDLYIQSNTKQMLLEILAEMVHSGFGHKEVSIQHLCQ
jgi:4-hydroxyphenylpyruvate dioxygenase-like putative hemolysin